MFLQHGHHAGDPRHGLSAASERVVRVLGWIYDHTWPRREQWDGFDDDGQDIADIFGDQSATACCPRETIPDSCSCSDDCDCMCLDCICAACGDEDVPGNPDFDRRFWGESYGQPGEPGEDVHLPEETAQAVPPRQVHHQAVLLRDGTLLMKTPGEPPAYNSAELDDTLVNLRPEPRSGASAWTAQLRRDRPQTWVDELVESVLGVPTVELYMWGWQQRRAIAA